MCDFRRFMIFPTCLKSLLRELSSAVGKTAYLCFPPAPSPFSHMFQSHRILSFMKSHVYRTGFQRFRHVT